MTMLSPFAALSGKTHNHNGCQAMKRPVLMKTLRAAMAAATLLSGSVFLATTTPAAAQSVVQVGQSGNQTERITLGLDKSIVIDLPADANDILVANPEVADAVTRTARRIYLFGKQVGSTNIFVFDAQGRQIVSLDLQIERDVAGLDRYLERFLPNSQIKTEIINDNIVLTGRVQTPQDSAKAERLAEIFVNGGAAAASSEAVSIFTRVATSDIVNLLEIAGGDQVTLKVTVAEIQRSVMKQLGVNLLANRSGDNGIVTGIVNSGLSTAIGKPLSLASGATLGGAIGGAQIDAYFQAMEQSGVMRTLATPSLTAVSGEKAVFKAGGEYNLVRGSSVDPETGAVEYEIEQLEYGVGLEFTPVVLSPGRISLRIRTSVSEPTIDGAQTLGVGATRGSETGILSIRKRLADTSVELPSGGSMMIAGLLRDDVRTVVNGFPGLSKVPVLGALFRSQEFVRNESELVILVTPYLVRPVAESELARPTDNLSFSNGASSALLGRVNQIYGTAKNNQPTGRYHGSVGFIVK